MSPQIRVALGVAAAVNLLAAAGFALRQPWALALWPWDTGPLSYIFLGSMLAAIGAAAAWIAWSGETGSLPAGFLNLTVTFAGIAISPAFTEGVPGMSAVTLIVIITIAAGNVALFWVTRRLPEPTSEPVPLLLRASYAAFTLILLAVGVALILRMPEIMPWSVDDDVSVVFGWIFLGDAWYFAYAVFRPDWQSARAQLWSFLAYDVVLLGPLVSHLDNVSAQLRTNLLSYLAVMAYSGVLAMYYLIANPATRGWPTQRASSASAA